MLIIDQEVQLSYANVNVMNNLLNEIAMLFGLLSNTNLSEYEKRNLIWKLYNSTGK